MAPLGLVRGDGPRQPLLAGRPRGGRARAGRPRARLPGEAADLHRKAAIASPIAALDRVKQGYTTGARMLASRSIVGLARTRVTPNALTTSGVSLCLAAAVIVYFEDRNDLLFYWVGAAVFVVGSILDILDGALARAGGKATPFGSFLDSTTDRVGEGAMLGAIALIFSRHGNEIALGAAIAAVAGSFLVSYTRAKAEALGLRGDVGLGSRGQRGVAITAGPVPASL